VERKSAEAAAAWEAEKLRRLAEKGLPVPEILVEGEGFFVMTDRGEGLAGLLKRAEAELAKRWLEGVVDALAALHRAGEYHGASQIRNFVLDGDEGVGIIDFEESFPADSDLKALQFRDLFLLLYSLHRQKQEADYPVLLRRYMAASGNESFEEELRALYHRFRWLAKLVEPERVRRRLGSDAEILHRLFESIRAG
jgi:tRNA A-37 threonylcarbamoyl transferase component Bud32